MLAYNEAWNCAYCPKCAEKALSGNLDTVEGNTMHEQADIRPIELTELQAMWSNESNPDCGWCGEKLWGNQD